MVATMRDQPDIEVVAEIHDESDIPGILEETSPEFLVITLDSPGKRPHLCDFLLARYPRTKILALAPDGEHSVFYWVSFDIHAASFEASEKGILNALRFNSNAIGRRH